MLVANRQLIKARYELYVLRDGEITIANIKTVGNVNME